MFAMKVDFSISNQHEYPISLETRVAYLNNFILIPNVPCLEHDYWSVIKKENEYLTFGREIHILAEIVIVDQ